MQYFGSHCIKNYQESGFFSAGLRQEPKYAQRIYNKVLLCRKENCFGFI